MDIAVNDKFPWPSFPVFGQLPDAGTLYGPSKVLRSGRGEAAMNAFKVSGGTIPTELARFAFGINHESPSTTDQHHWIIPRFPKPIPVVGLMI
jgi:hypothetical protein